MWSLFIAMVLFTTVRSTSRSVVLYTTPIRIDSSVLTLLTFIYQSVCFVANITVDALVFWSIVLIQNEKDKAALLELEREMFRELADEIL